MAGSNASVSCTFVAIMLMTLLVVQPQPVSALTCGQVAGYISSCINYARGVGPLVPSCCNGVRGLNGAARTTVDRQTACSCLKSATGRIPGLRPPLVSGLPGRCGVRIPYPISTSTDCTKVR